MNQVFTGVGVEVRVAWKLGLWVCKVLGLGHAPLCLRFTFLVASCSPWGHDIRPIILNREQQRGLL